MASADQVIHDALSLSATERAEIARRLLATLEPEGTGESEDEVAAAWGDELARRRAEIREGRVVLRDWDEVLREIAQSVARQEPL